MTSPRAARLAAGLVAAAAAAVVVVLPGRHAALAAPNDYATDSSVPDDARSPLPVANTDVFDPWDRVANHRGPLPYNPYPGVPVTNTDRSDQPLPEADFMKDNMQEATDLTHFIMDRVEAQTWLAFDSILDTDGSFLYNTPLDEQRELVKNLLSTIMDVINGLELLTGIEGREERRGWSVGPPPMGSTPLNASIWIKNLGICCCMWVRRFLIGEWEKRLPSFNAYEQYLSSKKYFDYDRHRRHLKVLKTLVDAVEILAAKAREPFGEQKQSVNYEKYNEHFRELDTFLEKAGSLDNVLKTPYMDIDGSLSSSEMWSAREKLLAIENNISKP